MRQRRSCSDHLLTVSGLCTGGRPESIQQRVQQPNYPSLSSPYEVHYQMISIGSTNIADKLFSSGYSITVAPCS